MTEADVCKHLCSRTAVAARRHYRVSASTCSGAFGFSDPAVTLALAQTAG